MPGVNIRIVKENSAASTGYDTLVEADSENTKVVTVESELVLLFFSLTLIEINC